jgi:hypothetical protein
MLEISVFAGFGIDPSEQQHFGERLQLGHGIIASATHVGVGQLIRPRRRRGFLLFGHVAFIASTVAGQAGAGKLDGGETIQQRRATPARANRNVLHASFADPPRRVIPTIAENLKYSC